MTRTAIAPPVPPQLAEVVTELVELSLGQADQACDGSPAVDDLVAVSRWNPALLMVAAEQVSELIEARADGRFEVALDRLRAAEQRVRRRVY